MENVRSTDASHPQVEEIHPSVKSFVKRLMDIVGASIGLSIAAIIAIPVAIAMHFDSPGPLFYTQMRCGYKGRHFRMWKFRSMVVNADRQKHLVKNQANGHIFKSNNDPRITRVGRFLRRTSLDELPQFWNILIGDMSLVGTRPPIVDEYNKYQPHHKRRLDVKPGLTGEWQTRGRSTIIDFEKIVELDLLYQHKWSIFYDLKLILKTFAVVFKREGAW
ncbi:MAG: sugar transferase [Oscillatoria sp. SIO1A7]|nr:sugar transferase [Oscillatoria sp. SIO1A7]